jgi:UDP-GlcNAc:undecaprenyl-phosphate/decaprenyl-phosphate GlcNAc-1-phosphate transferase
VTGGPPAGTAALAVVVSFLASLALAVPASRLALRLGLVDRPGPRKRHRAPTPYLGGAAVAGGLVLGAATPAAASGALAVVLVAGLGVAVLGLVDDWMDLAAAPKLVVEIAAAVALWLAGIRAEVTGVAPLDLAVTVGWVVVVTNAVNLLDNMDGLAAGTAAIAALTCGILAHGRGEPLLGTLALATAGAAAGFLCHNFPPARIFLGDAGALLLGFVLAAMALEVPVAPAPAFARAAVPALLVGVPLLDTTLVILDRLRGGRPVHVGGTDHMSHRLAALGLSPRRVAVAVYAAQAGCSALALWVARAPVGAGRVGVVVAVGGFVLALAAFLVLPRLSASGSPPRA